MRGTRSVRSALALIAASLAVSRGEARAESGAEPGVARLGPNDLLRLVPNAERELGNLGLAWRFHAGDDPSFADPSLDDSSWPLVDPRMIRGLVPAGFTGAGWFRVRVSVDPALRERSLGVVAYHVGHLELWVDGEHLATFGVPGPDRPKAMYMSRTTMEPLPRPIALGGPEHTIAVRYEVDPWMLGQQLPYVGFALRIDDFDHLTAERVAQIYRQALLNNVALGVALAFSVLYFLLFLFDRRRREYLLFALATFSTGGIVWSTHSMRFVVESDGFQLWTGAFRASITGTTVFGLWFVYSIFRAGPSLQLRILRVLGVALVILAPWLPTSVVYVFAILALFDQARVVIGALRTRSKGAWVLAAGILAMFLLSTWTMLVDMRIVPPVFWYAYLIGFELFVLSMAAYLARTTAITNRDLARRLVEVEELSEHAIEQERRFREEEVARKLLEAENARKEKELEEAKKLQQALADLERAHSELQKTQAQLLQSEKMASLGLLVAGIAHEINTPVGAIGSMRDSLSRAVEKLKVLVPEVGGEAALEHPKLKAALKVIEEGVRVIDSASSRVAGIVKRLRSFARLDEAEKKRADLHEGLEDTLMLVHHELKHGAKVIKKYGEIPQIVCYPSQLNQVFLNLLINAKQALPKEGGEITIETRLAESGRKVEVLISDNGSGIAPENLSRIFDPGFTTKGVGVGTGLGLAICYQIVQTHKGEIRVDSGVGKGTTFTVVLPAVLDAEPA